MAVAIAADSLGYSSLVGIAVVAVCMLHLVEVHCSQAKLDLCGLTRHQPLLA